MLKNKRIYLSSPHIGSLEQQYISEAFATNWVAPLGPNVDAFEHEVAEYVGVKGAVALSSGTAALHLALRLLGVGKEDTVFCSALTFVASANPILYQKAVPVFIDSEPESWNMSPTALTAAFKEAAKKGKLPRAVIIVNLYGQSADMDQLLPICQQYEVPVIEDAAESLGATYRGQQSGGFGRFSVFSFNGNKIITTSGGGMLLSNELPELEKAYFWATQARDQARHYQHSEMGYNYRLSNILAGIGRGQLKVLADRIAARRAVFDRYQQAFGNIEGLDFMPEASYGTSTRWLTALTLNPAKCWFTTDEIIDVLASENIESRPVWKPLQLQPLFTECEYYPHHPGLSVSEQLFNQGLCLPSGSNLTEAELERVIATVWNYIENK